MKKVGKKLAAASLCACLAATALTGCGDTAEKTVLKVDDTKASYGLVNLSLRVNQAQMHSIYSMFLGEDIWSTYGESTRDSVVSSVTGMFLLEDHMEDYGVSISAEEEEAIASAAQEFVDSNDEEVLEAISGTQENVERLLTLYTIQDKMYPLIIAEADTTVTDEEAAQKTVQYVLFSTAGTTDSDGNSVEMTDEEKAEKKSQAEALLELVKGGTDMAEALTEIGEDRSPVSSSYGADNGSLSDALKEAAETLTDGEVAEEIIETDGGYYVLQMVTTFDEEATAEYKEELVEEKQSEYYNSVLTTWKEDAEVTTDDDLLAKMDFVDTFELKSDETEASTEAATEAASEAETTEAVTEAETTEAVTEAETTETATTEAE